MGNILKIGLWGMLMLILTSITLAQEVSVSGRVSDMDSAEPLPGVTILEMGTSNGTITDFEGNYKIEVPENAMLQFSFVGYETKVIQLNGQSILDVQLRMDNQQLEELVVIGYGTTTKQKLTGAVASVTPESFKAGPITTLGDALQGNAAGLMIQNNGGQPGAEARINIRGVNSLTGGTQPLIVVDGFPLFDVQTSGGGGLESFSSQMSPLAFINPADIKSVEVLKDASATAIYGNRGANGVILITTKRGTERGSRISYSNFFGLRKLTKQLDMLNFEQYAQYQNLYNPGNTLFTDPATNELYDFDYEDIPSVNWQDEIYRNGFVQNHSLSIQNSSEKSSMFFSLAYMNDRSILLGSDFKKYNAKLGLEHNHTDKLTFGGDLSFNYIEYDGVPTEGRAGTATGVTMQSLLAAPFDLRNPKTYKEFVEDAFVPQVIVDNFLQNDRGNPVIQATDTEMKKTSNRFLGNAFVSYDIIDHLSLRVSAATDVYQLKDRQFYPSTTPTGNLYDGLAIVANVQSINVLNENILAYENRIAEKHDINITGGYTQQVNNYEYIRSENSSLENESLGYNQVGAASFFRNISDVQKLRLESFLFRFIYTFDEKLSIMGSARLDGTSRFLVDKWGDFYSIGATYDLARDLAASSDFLNGLKFRASFGQVGNANVSTLGAFAQLRQTNYTFNDVEVQGLSASNLANESLTWETTNEINMGLDFSLGDTRRLTGSIDYYIKQTNDLILQTPVPNISGFSSAYQNIGSIRNTGLEISLQSAVMSSSSFSWDIAANFTYIKGEVLELGQDGAPIYVDPFFEDAYKNEFILREGGQIGEIFGFESDGIYTDADFDSEGNLLPGVIRGLSTPLPGDLKLKDLNGDDEINDDDRTVLGSTMPKYFGGLSNTWTMGRFDLKLMLQYFLDYDVFNASKTRYARFIGGSNNVSTDWVNRWTPETPDNTQYARIANTIVVDKYVEEGSLLRISNVKLGYTLPPDFLGTRSLNVYISVDNAWIWTKYNGYDPEVSTNHSDNSMSSAVSSGIDYGSFPRARSYMAGLSLTF